VTPPAASSTSSATVDLKSTDSGAAAGHLEDPAVAAGQSRPLAAPAAPSADAVPCVPSSGAQGAISAEVKPAELVPPYFGHLDLVIEDKSRSFDRISAMVSRFEPFSFFIGSTSVLLMGVAPEATSKRSRLLAVSYFPHRRVV